MDDETSSMHGSDENAYKILVGKSERKGRFWRYKHTWEVQ
jgi:hypothetical protein